MLIFIGHSFGALALESAMKGIFISDMERRKSDPNPQSIPTFADLIVYVNSAAAATEAHIVLEYLAQNRITYREDDPNLPPGNGLGRDRPFFLSVSTPADMATARILPIAHYGSGLIQKLHGELNGHSPLSCFDPATNYTTPNVTLTEFNFYVTSAPHMNAIQSHQVVDRKPLDAAGNCPALTPGATSLYDGVPGHCFEIQPKNLGMPKNTRCNGTPYWILDSDSNIIPDHGTIFTDRLITFIGPFLPDSGSGQIVIPKLMTEQERLAQVFTQTP